MIYLVEEPGNSDACSRIGTHRRPFPDPESDPQHRTQRLPLTLSASVNANQQVHFRRSCFINCTSPLSSVAPPLSACGDVAVASARASSLSAGSRRPSGAPCEFLLGGDRSDGRGRRSPHWSAGGAGAWHRGGASARSRSHGGCFWQQRRHRFRALASGHRRVVDGRPFAVGDDQRPHRPIGGDGRGRLASPSFWGFTLRCYSLLSTPYLTAVVQHSESDCMRDRP